MIFLALTFPAFVSLAAVPTASLQHPLPLLLDTAFSIVLLLLLILRLKMHPAISLLIAALTLGLSSGMPMESVPSSIATGVGTLLGHVAMVLALGAVLGQMLRSSGGTAALGNLLVNRFGERGLPWAMLLLGLLVGLPVFFEVGLVLLAPVMLAVAERTGRSRIVTALPTLAGLSAAHGLIPPHPAAMMAVEQFHADLSRTMIVALITGIPAAALAGPVYAWAYQRWMQRSVLHWVNKQRKLPLQATAPAFRNTNATLNTTGAGRALLVLLTPVLLIFIGNGLSNLLGHGLIPGSVHVSTLGLTLAKDSPALHMLSLLGDANIALLIAVILAYALLRPEQPAGSTRLETLRTLTSNSFHSITEILIILGAAGAYSRVLQDSGAATATVHAAMTLHVPALLLAWLMAVAVRLATGSATVAMAITSGLLAPLAGVTRPELLVIATGSGSLFFSHLNDPGFWMIKEFFGLEVKETLATWSILETILSVSGLAAALLFSYA